MGGRDGVHGAAPVAWFKRSFPVAGPMNVTAVTKDKATGKAIVVGVTSTDDKRQAPNLGMLLGDEPTARFLIENKTTSLGFGSVQSVPAMSAEKALILVGLGDTSKLTQEKLGTCISNALKHAKGLGFDSVSTTLLEDCGMERDVAAQALVEGAICGDLSFDQWKSQPKKKQPKSEIKRVQIVCDGRALAGVKKAVKTATIMAEAVNDARLLANTPANVATPKWMAAEARKRGQKHGFKVSVKGRAALRKEGFNALCGVAQGSDNEEQLITCLLYTSPSPRDS